MAPLALSETAMATDLLLIASDDYNDDVDDKSVAQRGRGEKREEKGGMEQFHLSWCRHQHRKLQVGAAGAGKCRKVERETRE